MKLKIISWLKIFLPASVGIFICDQVHAQKIFSDPVIQKNYDLIGQMQALKSMNQRPASNNSNNNNTNNNSSRRNVDPSANDIRVDAYNSALDFGWKAFREGNYEEAKLHFWEMIRLYPHEFYPYNLLLDALIHQHHYSEAEDVLQTARNNGLSKTQMNKVLEYFHCCKGKGLLDIKDFANAELEFREAVRLNAKDGGAWNNLGVAFDWQDKNAEAKDAYEIAVKFDPEPLYQNNLAGIKQKIANADRVKEQLDKDKINASNIHQSIQNLVQTLNSPTTGELISTPANSQPKPALDFGDPMVVNASNVPSGLPKQTDNAILRAYKNAPVGVSDRVRKGFQAVATKDWNVAKAWFQDALKLDPDNKGLQEFIALCDYNPENKQHTISLETQKNVAVVSAQTPGQSEIDEYFTYFFSPSGKVYIPSDKVNKYINSMPLEDFKKYMYTHIASKELDEHLFNQVLEVIQQQNPQYNNSSEIHN